MVLDIFGSADGETMEKIANLDWGLIEYLIELIITLYELILSLINFIIDIFTPNAL